MKDQDAEERKIACNSKTSPKAVRQQTDLIAAESLPGEQIIRQLFQDYVRMYSLRDDLLTAEFSENFSGFTGGGDFLVKDKEEWVNITRQDFAQIKDAVRIELKDLAIQSLAETIAAATGFFNIHLPIKDHILSRQIARLVLIFRKEVAGWKICHSSISIPYHLVNAGEIYPLKELTERSESLERLVEERTIQLSSANDSLAKVNEELGGEEGHRQFCARVASWPVDVRRRGRKRVYRAFGPRFHRRRRSRASTVPNSPEA